VEDATTLLFALPDYRVLDVSLEPDGGRRVLVEAVAEEAACPHCGVFSRVVHERPVRRVKDVPHGRVPLRLWVRKRRYRCVEAACPRRSFTEATDELPLRSRLTGRLRERVTAAVTRTNRAVSEVAAEHGIAWGTVHRLLVAAAAQRLGQAEPTTRIGIDETRARSVRWLLTEADETAGTAPVWRRSDPWMTSIVDLDPAHAGGILGLTPGRTGACVEAWLELQTPAFRDAVAVVAIDPSAPVCGRDPPSPAERADRGGSLAPGPAGEPDGHRGPPAGPTRAARAPRHPRRPCLDAPQAPAARRGHAEREGPWPG